jgi:CspA family cold shock protein
MANIDPTPFTTTARVRKFSNATGWGVLDPAEGSADDAIWFHWSVLEMRGYKTVEPGRLCEVEVERAKQDGYRFRAVRVRD